MQKGIRHIRHCRHIPVADMAVQGGGIGLCTEPKVNCILESLRRLRVGPAEGAASPIKSGNELQMRRLSG